MARHLVRHIITPKDYPHYFFSTTTYLCNLFIYIYVSRITYSHQQNQITPIMKVAFYEFKHSVPQYTSDKDNQTVRYFKSLRNRDIIYAEEYVASHSAGPGQNLSLRDRLLFLAVSSTHCRLGAGAVTPIRHDFVFPQCVQRIMH